MRNTLTMEKVIEIALNEVGYREKPPFSNSTKYGKWFGLNGVQWCGIFVSWVFDQAGRNLGNIGYTKGFAGCMTAIEHYRKKGCIVDNPQPADIVFYDWKGNGKYTHVGIVYRICDDGTIEAIEGNTSLSNSDNGGRVMIRKRKLEFCTFVRV